MRCALCNEGLKYKEKKYMQIHDTAFIAPGAVVQGDVTIGENSGIWYNAVVRGDRDSIVIGKASIFRTMRSCIWAADIRWRSETM